MNWKLLRSLTIASIKMYFRNVSAVFFTLFIPIMLVVIFGLLSGGDGKGSIKVDLKNYSSTPMAKSYVEAVKKIDVFKINEVDESKARDDLGKGKVDLEVVIPKEFGEAGAAGLKPAEIKTYFNKSKPGNGTSASLIFGQVANQFNNQLTGVPQIITLKSEGVTTNNLGYIDYLLPGIMAMSIMQLGIFSVAFGFISYKTSGALRRLQATPTSPANFLVAQSITRLIIGFLQVGLLLALGIWLFHMHLVGNVFTLLTVATLGTLMFLAFGFAVAGWARDENQAAPVANLVSFPMLFLSGTFFPRDNFPAYLQHITDYLPLTFVADAMRVISNEGASLWAVRGDVLGIVVWGVIGYLIADKLFSWE